MEVDYVRDYQSGNLVWSDEFNNESEDSQLSWDFDGNGVADALTDGLLFLRHTFDLTGSPLFDGVIASNSSLSLEEIESKLNLVYEIADIDESGNVDALTDGLVV